MIGLYVMFGTMLFVVGLIAVLDWYSRHNEKPAGRK